MLIEFSVENYRSIREKITFSMVASDDYYTRLKPKLEQAIKNAERLEKEQQEIGKVHPNPSTKVHYLV